MLNLPVQCNVKPVFVPSWQMSLLKVEMEEVIKFRDDTELEKNQLLEQVWWQ